MAMPLRLSTCAIGIAVAGAWTYGEPRGWPAADNHCGDTSGQSPIDIVAEAASSEGTAALSFQGSPDAATDTAIRGDLETNGHTWEVGWDLGYNATEQYGVVYQGKVYRLAQYHYHSPSEHTVHGAHFDMEAHHVHYCISSNCQTEQQDDEILVVAVWLREGAENPYLSTFWSDFTGSDVTIGSLANPYENFFPESQAYYSYVGSTTTPPCVPSVNWVLMQESVTLSAQQLNLYRMNISRLPQPAVLPAAPIGVTPGWNALLKTNNRQLQPLGIRVVASYIPQDSSDAQTRQMKIATFCAGGGLLLCLVSCAVYRARRIPDKQDEGKRAVKRSRGVVARKQAPPAPPPAAAPQNIPLMIMQPQPLMQAMPVATTTFSLSRGPAAVAMPTAQYTQLAA